jgi:hypothetical protein
MACTCDLGFGNTGTPACVPIGNVTYRLIGVPTYDSSGVRNSIDTTATLDSTYFTDRLNAGISGATITDSNQRWFPLPSMKNVEDVRGDDLTESFNDASESFIRVGPRTFNAVMLKNPSPVLLGKIESWRCSQISVFVIDIDGQIIGNGGTDGFLYPFALDSETWSPKYVKTTDTTVPKLMLNYTYSQSENDKDIRVIEASETSVDMKNLNGLQDVTAVISNEATTGFTVTLTGSYGSAITANKIKGMVLADFDCNETSPTPGAEPLTSVTESADGVYDVVYTTPVASADVLSLDLQKNGFEMTTAVITTP